MEGELEWEVEEILLHREIKRRKDTKIEYYIKWAGYGPEHSTWDPESNLQNEPKPLSYIGGRNLSFPQMPEPTKRNVWWHSPHTYLRGERDLTNQNTKMHLTTSQASTPHQKCIGMRNMFTKCLQSQVLTMVSRIRPIKSLMGPCYQCSGLESPTSKKECLPP